MINKKLEKNRLNCAFLMFLIYPVYNLLLVSKQYLGEVIPDNYLMIFLYSIVLVYSIVVVFKAPIYKKSFFSVLGIYFIVFLLYLVSDPLVKSEYYSTYNWIMYIYFIPISAHVITRIVNWNELFTNKKYIIISDIILFASLISKLYFNDNTDYMAFSYDLLPFACIVLICAVMYKQKSQWIFSLMSLFILGVFGARGALMAFLLCGVFISILMLYYSNSRQKLINRIITLGLISMLCIFGISMILPKLINTNLLENSYILKRISMGSLDESNARELIIKMSLKAIRGMGLNIYGLYYDRVILPNGWYSHNFIIESLLSLGWFFGISFLIWIFYSIFNGYKKQGFIGKCIFVFAFTTLFVRYFISGSIFGEGKFIMFMAIIISLKKKRIIDENHIDIHNASSIDI